MMVPSRTAATMNSAPSASHRFPNNTNTNTNNSQGVAMHGRLNSGSVSRNNSHDGNANGNRNRNMNHAAYSQSNIAFQHGKASVSSSGGFAPPTGTTSLSVASSPSFSSSLSSSPPQSKTLEQAIQDRLDRFDAQTALPRLKHLNTLRLDRSAIQTTDFLGRGTFCVVHKASLASRPGQPFALKSLHPHISDRALRKGAIDLGIEAKLLSRLSHPNIIRIHGVAKGSSTSSSTKSSTTLGPVAVHSSNNSNNSSSSSFGNGGVPNFFILMDYLTATLDSVLDDWKQEESSNNKLANFLLNKNHNNNNSSNPSHPPTSTTTPPNANRANRLLHRIESAAIGIARGMEYLHSKGIIYRDLKPQNIGFDLQGTVRIFDFGVAREMHQVLLQGERLGFTGTPRYMANEVGAGDMYDLSADVYSFGVLLWQICTLRLPFHKMNSLDDYQASVVTGHKRPPLGPVKNADLSTLIGKCWNLNPNHRPTFSAVVTRLEGYIAKSVRDNPRSVASSRMQHHPHVSAVPNPHTGPQQQQQHGLNSILHQHQHHNNNNQGVHWPGRRYSSADYFVRRSTSLDSNGSAMNRRRLSWASKSSMDTATSSVLSDSNHYQRQPLSQQHQQQQQHQHPQQHPQPPHQHCQVQIGGH